MDGFILLLCDLIQEGGIEIDREYCRMAAQRLQGEQGDFFNHAELQFRKQINTQAEGPVVREERTEYRTRRKVKTAQAITS